MRKQLITTCLLVLISFVSQLNAQELRIGLVQKQFIIEQLAKKESAYQNLQKAAYELQNKQHNDLLKVQAEYQETIEALKQNLSQKEKDKHLTRIKDLEAEPSRLAMRMQQEIKEIESQAIKTLDIKVDKAIAEVVKKRNIEHLILQNTSQGQPVILYADPETNKAYNITSEVLEALKINRND